MTNNAEVAFAFPPLTQSMGPLHERRFTLMQRKTHSTSHLYSINSLFPCVFPRLTAKSSSAQKPQMK